MSNESKFIPNFLQVPNAVIDELLPDLTGAELKCYLVVIRKTKGWNKESDNISISQFMKATGLSNSAVIKACESLVKYGLLVKENGSRNTGVYTVNSYSKTTYEKSSQVTCEESSPVKKVHSTYEKSSQVTCEESSPVKKVHSTYEKSSQVTCEESSHTINNIKNTTQNTNTNLTVSNARARKTSKSAVEILEQFGITGQLAKDFIAHRKAKKSVITETVLNGFQRESDKAGIPLAEAIEIAICQNWQGFRADWCKNLSGAKGKKRDDFADDGSWAIGRTVNVPRGSMI
ncbi:replication protein [Aggregatibacter segnis]|uniref:replication protein n=1 Tax=Aggregatibacter segnis TaxID=739 RepID=UPI0028EB2AC9|nr:replication protein [Aggregatibacter segnis]